MKKTIFYIIFLVLLSGCGNIHFKSTAEDAIILEIDENTILIENMFNEQRKIHVSSEVIETLEINRSYYVHYSYLSEKGRAELISIDPNPIESEK